MSCTMLSETHYNAILKFAARYGNSGNRAAYFYGGKWSNIDWTNAAELADVCARANARAYAARYRETYDAPPHTTSDEFDKHTPDITPAEALKAIISAEYQCSDWPDYDTSQARAILDALKDYAIQAMPEYIAAQTWDIDYQATRAELDALKA